ncbi:active regulator of SIRT1-like [Thrips palmi]|uniref:Active regulator of SIRT1-like n=1 Tax=Thrips palmi TaxID=161013 RepID=A0A6P8ZWL7_THRPL|nr:active regulator of SIRT1-like [Thrips palmi]
MSSTLVKKALELFETDADSKSQPPKKSQQNESRKDLKARKRALKRSDRVLGDVKSKAALQVDVARRISSGNKDRTNENLKALMALGSVKPVDFKKAEKIFNQTVKRKRPVDDTAPPAEPSMFSEEDFKKFEEEYFVNSSIH